MEHLHARLSRGQIDVEIDATSGAWSAQALFGFAERQNPKRAFLFVSKVLGRHIPVPPARIQESFRDLAAQLDPNLPGPVVVIGFAETAVGLAAGVHRAYRQQTGRTDVLYWCSTRHALGTPLLAQFDEDHSHATRHLLHQPQDALCASMLHRAGTVVLVDDEASTGQTFVNLHKALLEAGVARAAQWVLVTLTDWSDGAAEAALAKASVASVSLARGRYRWRADPNVAPLPLPEPPTCAAGPKALLDPSLDWGRLGRCTSPTQLLNAYRGETPNPGDRYLVLGTGEYVFEPYLLSEALAESCAEAAVYFGSVTRSPILLGHEIKHICQGSDNYGLGIGNYVYNVAPNDYTHILVCTETAYIDPVLYQSLQGTDVRVTHISAQGAKG